MSVDEINRIAVLGAGTMGHGIAEVAAIAGYDVALRDIEEDLVQEGYAQIEWSLDKLVEHDRIEADTAEAALERVEPVVDMAAAVGSADFVIEAVPEQLDIKRDVFAEVSEHAPDDATFATNTSSLSITAIAAETDRPERFCGMHFFNPPVRRDLVEVIAGEQTTEETLELTERLAEDMDKISVRVNKDSPGFIVNRVLTPLLNEAAWLVYHDEATMEEVDATGTYEIGLPMGAFELTDLVGIDVAYHVLDYIHGELGDAYAPCPLLEEKIEAGDLGQKTDRGFYEYDNGGVSVSADAASPELAERMLAIMANEVAKLLAEDVASVDAIDTAMELGTAFPDGPAKLADAHGLESLVDHLDERYAETEAARYTVSEELRERAAGAGFYETRETAEQESTFEDIRIEYPTEHVGHIIIDREHRMNAISPTILEELPAAVDRLENEDDIRAILLTGAGDRAFSAGADITGMAAVWGDIREVAALSKRGQEAFGRLQDTNLPVIAAIDGYCLGGGMELATAADLRIATDRSTFGQTERDLGLLPGWGGTQRLPPIVGLGRAKEIVFTGDHYDAEQMERYGFVNRVIPADAFEETAIEFAADIAQGPPIAFEYAKRAFDLATHPDSAGLEFESSSFGQLVDTDDLAEGVSAFMEDRDPAFEGK